MSSNNFTSINALRTTKQKINDLRLISPSKKSYQIIEELVDTEWKANIEKIKHLKKLEFETHPVNQ